MCFIFLLALNDVLGPFGDIRLPKLLIFSVWPQKNFMLLGFPAYCAQIKPKLYIK